MIFESLKVENLMGCKYYMPFDPNRFTVVIGPNKSGKTLVPRLIMLSLCGLGRDSDIHHSWKLNESEIGIGYVELIFRGDHNERYKIRRDFNVKQKITFYRDNNGNFEPIKDIKGDSDVKQYLDENVGITPLLMNVVMSNEENLLGMMSYDEDLQSHVWKGWEWKSEIIKNNILRYSENCNKEARIINDQKTSSEKVKRDILKNWYEKEIFKEEDYIDKDVLEVKYKSIIDNISKIAQKITNYKTFKNELHNLKNLEDLDIINKMIKLCETIHLDDKEGEDEHNLLTETEQYLQLLNDIIHEGREQGIKEKLIHLEDELKKFESSKNLKDRKLSPLSITVSVYPPDGKDNLFVEFHDDVPFSSDEMENGHIVVKWSKEKESQVITNKNYLEELIKNYKEKRENVGNLKETLRDNVETKNNELSDLNHKLENMRDALTEKRQSFIYLTNEIIKQEKEVEVLKTAGNWFRELHSNYNDEGRRKMLRDGVLSFINDRFKDFGWLNRVEFVEINGKKVKYDLLFKDEKGTIISHPSGAETEIIGFAWRWMTAKSFELPLVCDELDALLDSSNIDKVKDLITRYIDRQTIILTYKEGLKDLPGKVYRIKRVHGISTIDEIGSEYTS